MQINVICDYLGYFCISTSITMKNRTQIPSFIIVAGIVCTAIFLSSNNVQTQQDSARVQHQTANVLPPPIPTSIVFAGDTIDLTLQDRRERIDKEMLSFTYSHINTMLIIKRANRLFPIVEPILEECGLPDDFKYLMIIESNGDPEALSPSKAAGLWQFLEKTGREYNLEVTEEIDERYHTEKATRAACEYLKGSYELYGDWLTVAASYNTGRANVTKRRERQKEEKAIDILLPNETSRYIFRLMAVKTILENPAKYGFMLRSSDLYPAIPIEKEVTASGTTIDWVDLARKHGLTFMQLREANHWIRRTTLNNKTGKTYKVLIPNKESLRYNPAKTKAHNKNWVLE